MKKIALILTGLLMAGSVAAQTAENNLGSAFTWGAEAGGSIDMTGANMSSIDLDVFFGYKNKYITAVGVGAGFNIMTNKSVTAFPIYALLRTSFSEKPKLCFLDFRIGAIINEISDSKNKTGFYLEPGVGIYLATGKTFKSYLVLSYKYNGGHWEQPMGPRAHIAGLNMASVRLGISF